MPAHGFYNANEAREYPFIYKGYRPDDGDSIDDSVDPLPRRALVDFHCLFGPDARLFNENDVVTRRVVYLAEIRRDADLYEFEFRVNVSPTDQFALVFTADADAAEWTILFAEAVRASPPDSSDFFDYEGFIWEGCLVLGVLADLEMVNGETRTFTPLEWQIEPALVQTTEYLQTLNLGNFNRTYAYDPCNTEDYDPPQVVLPYAQALRGPLRLREGYNCSIRQDDVTNTITIAAALGAGQGEPCAEVPLSDDEQSLADDGELLSGGPKCDEIIATINGAGGRNIRLKPGPGVTVERDPDDPHGLIITVDLTAFNACLADTSDSSSEGA